MNERKESKGFCFMSWTEYTTWWSLVLHEEERKGPNTFFHSGKQKATQRGQEGAELVCSSASRFCLVGFVFFSALGGIYRLGALSKDTFLARSLSSSNFVSYIFISERAGFITIQFSQFPKHPPSLYPKIVVEWMECTAPLLLMEASHVPIMSPGSLGWFHSWGDYCLGVRLAVRGLCSPRTILRSIFFKTGGTAPFPPNAEAILFLLHVIVDLFSSPVTPRILSFSHWATSTGSVLVTVSLGSSFFQNRVLTTRFKSCFYLKKGLFYPVWTFLLFSSPGTLVI